MTEAFASGELCLLLDTRGRRYLFDLKEGSSFQYHAGYLKHDEIIGVEAGSVLRSSTGSKLVALRPRLADYILKMDRGAQVVYPKDLGPIIHWADIRPGHMVVEAGTGSGALAMALLNAVGPTGRVVTVERREDHLQHATKVIARFLGEIPPNLTMTPGSVEEVLVELTADRLILDLPEPWAVVEPAAEALVPGGILCSYLPTVPQVQRLHEALHRSGHFAAVETFENFIRDWKFSGRSVRPASMMVGHTGFLTTAHRTVGGSGSDDDPAEAGPS